MSAPEHNERRRREVSLLDQALAWISRAGIGLIVFFLLQIYQDIQGLKANMAEAKTDIAVLKERTRPTTREATR